jgi:hypothetical protein
VVDGFDQDQLVVRRHYSSLSDATRETLVDVRLFQLLDIPALVMEGRVQFGGVASTVYRFSRWSRGEGGGAARFLNMEDPVVVRDLDELYALPEDQQVLATLMLESLLGRLVQKSVALSSTFSLNDGQKRAMGSGLHLFMTRELPVLTNHGST